MTNQVLKKKHALSYLEHVSPDVIHAETRKTTIVIPGERSERAARKERGKGTQVLMTDQVLKKKHGLR